MRHNKQRIFYLVLAMILCIAFSALPVFAAEETIAAAEPVAAETTAAPETAEPDPASPQRDFDSVVFPGEDYLGKTWPEIVNNLKAYHGSNFDIDKNCSIENKTLEDGTTYLEGVITGVPSGEPDVTIDQYYYLPNDHLAACVYTYHVPGSMDMNVGKTNMENTYGANVPLDPSTLDSALLEMVSDQIKISSGMKSWKKQATSGGVDSWTKPGFTVVALTNDDARTMSIALIAQIAPVAKTNELKMSGLSGTEDLTPQEITMVNAYIDFLQSHVTQQVNEFIAYIKTQR